MKDFHWSNKTVFLGSDSPTLNIEKTETKSKSNLFNTERKELSKLRIDDTIEAKPAGKGEVAVNLSTEYYQSTIM